MQFNRTKNAARNIVFGFIQRIYQLLVPFAMRTAMIYWLGVEFLGLNGLFTSILSVLNLAELGVGSAMVYSMYKPVATDDKERICALIHLYKVYYRIIGIVVLIIGLIICPFIPDLVAKDMPEGINIYVLYLLNLSAAVISYWLFAYKNSLFQAYQRIDVVSKVTMGVNTVMYVVQFTLLFLFHNYYYYLIVALLSQVGINIITAIMADKMFPDLKPQGKLSTNEKKLINHRIRDLFTAKLGSVIVYSADTLVVSAFLGLTSLAIYQNYYYVVAAMLSIIGIFTSSCISVIGNSIITETKEKNYKDFSVLTFMIAIIATFCTSCLINLYQPFMEIWVGEELMLAFPAVVCFAIYFFVVQINTLILCYKDAAGIWHKDRFRPLVTGLTNLVMNLVMVQFWDIYGVLISTVLSILIVGMPWLFHNLFTSIFEKDMMRGYTFTLLKYVISAGLVSFVTYGLSNIMPFDGVILMVLDVVSAVIVTTIVTIIFYSRTEEYESAVLLIDRITNNRLKLSKLLLK